MLTARQKILAHVRKTGLVSTRGIARALKMSAPAVRHHLAILASDGRVESVPLAGRKRRGRPEKGYSLAQALLGDNLAALTDALLVQSGARLKVDALAENILDPAPFAHMPITKRLLLLVERLGALNYQPRWEAGGEGPRVIFGRCPYARVIDGHPELCKMDQALLEKALGRPVHASEKNDSGGRGLCPFVFLIR